MSDFITPDNLRLAMGLTFFPLGLLAILSGMVMLIAGPYRKESQALAAHSARIGQKGLTDDIGAVAQSATALIEAVNKLIRPPPAMPSSSSASARCWKPPRTGCSSSAL